MWQASTLCSIERRRITMISENKTKWQILTLVKAFRVLNPMKSLQQANIEEGNNEACILVARLCGI